jgi:hypothetical protein
MTAGASTVAYGIEDSFLGSVTGAPDYFGLGQDPVVEEAELSRALSRGREPNTDSAEPVRSLAQNLEGAFTVTFTPKDWGHHDFVFNATSPYSLTPDLASPARFFIGIDYFSGIAERELMGVVPTQYQVNYEQNEDIRVTITCVYADESKQTSVTPSSIDNSGTPHQFHGATLTVDSATVSKLQSATLSMENLYRLQRGTSEVAVEAVLDAPVTTLDVEAIFDGPSWLELAYGSSGSSSPQTSMSSVSGSLALSDGSNTTTFDFPQLKPDSYTWSNLINAEENLTDPTTFHVNGGVTVS